MHEVIVETHALKHGLSEEEIRYAWEHFLRLQHRSTPNEGQILCIGVNQKGQLIQMVAIEKPFGALIYHAMTPPTMKALKELSTRRSER